MLLYEMCTFYITKYFYSIHKCADVCQPAPPFFRILPTLPCVMNVHRSNKTAKQRNDGYQCYSVSKQDNGCIEISRLSNAVNIYFEFCFTGSLFYPAISLSQFAYRITWQKAAQRSLLHQFIVSRGLGVIFPCIEVSITDLCAVFKEEVAGAEFRLSDKHSLKKSLQGEFVVVELKTSFLNFF